MNADLSTALAKPRGALAVSTAKMVLTTPLQYLQVKIPVVSKPYRNSPENRQSYVTG